MWIGWYGTRWIQKRSRWEEKESGIASAEKWWDIEESLRERANLAFALAFHSVLQQNKDDRDTEDPIVTDILACISVYTNMKRMQETGAWWQVEERPPPLSPSIETIRHTLRRSYDRDR